MDEKLLFTIIAAFVVIMILIQAWKIVWQFGRILEITIQIFFALILIIPRSIIKVWNVVTDWFYYRRMGWDWGKYKDFHK